MTHVTIPLGRRGSRLRALVDEQDLEDLSRHRWRALWSEEAKTHYAYRMERRRAVFMHRQLLGLTDPSEQVDHRNHDGLDNRRENLRPCTNQQNQHNQRKRAGCTSRYKGVHWDFRNGSWRAAIKAEGRTIHLGRFQDEDDAARAYDDAARRLFGEFALTNSDMEIEARGLRTLHEVLSDVGMHEITTPSGEVRRIFVLSTDPWRFAECGPVVDGVRRKEARDAAE